MITTSEHEKLGPHCVTTADESFRPREGPIGSWGTRTRVGTERNEVKYALQARVTTLIGSLRG